MKNFGLIMMLLLASLSIPTTCFSQGICKDSLVMITAKQLKQTNIIFLEHKRLKERDSVMIKQIDEMDRLLAVYNSIDSINKQQLSSFKKQVEDQNKTIDDMSSKLIKSKKKNRRKNFVLGVLSVALVSIFAFVR